MHSLRASTPEDGALSTIVSPAAVPVIAGGAIISMEKGVQREAFVLSMRRIGTALSVASVFASTGCASIDEPTGSPARPGLSYVQTPSTKDLPAAPTAATAKSKPKVAAAAGGSESPTAAPKAPPPTKPAHLAQETACVSVDQCASVLKAMIDDPNRAWLSWPASATTLANGVRLFAYRALRSKLTCGELTTAVHEVTIAMAAFAGPVAGLQKSQIDRARMLTAQVEEELKTERAGRCENATGQTLNIRQGALPAVDAASRPVPAGHEVR